MTPNELVLTKRAITDIDRRAGRLRNDRGQHYAMTWTDALFDWLEKIARDGAIFGTAHQTHANIRTFGYKRQATILAEFEGGELRIIRIYFAGQDWTT